MTLAPYIIITAHSTAHLVIEVQKKMEIGYAPLGAPFNAGIYALPDSGISQAMITAAVVATTTTGGGSSIISEKPQQQKAKR